MFTNSYGGGYSFDETEQELELSDDAVDTPTQSNPGPHYDQGTYLTPRTTPSRIRNDSQRRRQEHRMHPYYNEWQQGHFSSPPSYNNNAWYEQTNSQILFLTESQKKITNMIEKMSER